MGGARGDGGEAGLGVMSKGVREASPGNCESHRQGLKGTQGQSGLQSSSYSPG